MSRFLTPTDVRLLRGVDLKDMPFKLLHDMAYRTDEIKDEIYINPKKGFRTNFANIPRFFWRVFGPPSGWYRDAAVVHDWLCPDEARPRATICSHKEAAAVFREASLDIVEFSEWGRFKRWRRVKQAYAMEKAVRYGGPKFKKGEM